jgi:hypothetical protein
MQTKKAQELQPEDKFSFQPPQRKIYTVSKIFPLTEERFKDQLLVIVENCRQLVISPETELVIK